MPSITHMKSLRKLKRKSNIWLANGTELIANKIEKLLIVCNGYNKMQPIMLSKGVGTMVPSKSLMIDNEPICGQQQQFYPCLGSRRIRNDRSKNNTILESNGALYVDNVPLKLKTADVTASRVHRLSIEHCKEQQMRIESDITPAFGLVHETCSECFQKIEDEPMRCCQFTVNPERIRRRRISRQFSV